MICSYSTGLIVSRSPWFKGTFTHSQIWGVTSARRGKIRIKFSKGERHAWNTDGTHQRTMLLLAS